MSLFLLQNKLIYEVFAEQHGGEIGKFLEYDEYWYLEINRELNM